MDLVLASQDENDNDYWRPGEIIPPATDPEEDGELTSHEKLWSDIRSLIASEISKVEGHNSSVSDRMETLEDTLGSLVHKVDGIDSSGTPVSSIPRTRKRKSPPSLQVGLQLFTGSYCDILL